MWVYLDSIDELIFYTEKIMKDDMLAKKMSAATIERSKFFSKNVFKKKLDDLISVFAIK